MPLGPPPIASDEEYVRQLNDPTFWEPWVRAALDQAGLPSPERMEPGRDLTYPTFLCDTAVVVKLFGPHWAGPESYAAEAAAYVLLRGTDLPVPRLLASGDLCPSAEGRSWPYLVLSRVPGRPYAARQDRLAAEEREGVARQLGAFLARLHALPLPREGPLATWDRFLQLLRRRRREGPTDHLRWGHLPPALCDELESFLPRDPASLLEPGRPPSFVHGDLHGEHVFVDPGTLRLTGVLDFTDASAGDPRYDLVALHLGTFRADKGLLAACLEWYGHGPVDRRWARAMLAFTLLHDFDVLAGVDPGGGRFRDLRNLDALAALLWDPAAPGLGTGRER